MNIDDYSFHDSTILTVIEHTENQMVDYLIDFPTDWKNNKFEKKTLRFTDVITHNIEETPFAGQPAIMEIVNHGLIQKLFGTGENQIKADRQKNEIKTNAGNRLIEFANCEFVK